MNKLFYAFLSILAFTSCMGTYNIQGTSNLSGLDGSRLYLKVLKNNEFKNVDSCEVVHGQFHFSGTIDSIRMANIFMDNESLLPLVLEKGNITVKLDLAQQNVTGTPMNDVLFKFFNQYNQLKARQAELIHKHDQAIMDGEDMNVVNVKLNQEANEISVEEDHLVTTFVTENFDNVLGPGVFFLITAGNRFPQLTPWIEDIMSKATDKFKNDPYVKEYYQKAQENQDIMNGMKDAPETQQAQPVPQLNPAPTPNELAAPANKK